MQFLDGLLIYYPLGYHNKRGGRGQANSNIFYLDRDILTYFKEEVIFRIIPENSGLFSGLIRKIVPYFPD